MASGAIDRDLDCELVSALVAEQFPWLASLAVARVGAGWDHEVFSLGTEWMVRFPKRAKRVAWLTREIEILDVLSESPLLRPKIPTFELIGVPSPAFPYPFVGYRKLEGVHADQVPTGDRVELARSVGRILDALHRTDPRRSPRTPSGWETKSDLDLQAELMAEAATVRPLLSGDPLDAAQPYLDGTVPIPARSDLRRFVHNDICPDHLIVDPDNGQLVGMIDFTDAMIGDPVVDFVGLIGIDGYRFISQVAANYGLSLGENFDERLRWMTRTLTLTWLAEAAHADATDVAKHRRWVTLAFE